MSVQASLPEVVTAVGGLGTAAFGLLDATKPVFGFNQIGFAQIRQTIVSLTPAGSGAASPGNPPSLSPAMTLATLEANWINGTDLASQKAIAKSLIKLALNPGTAAQMAGATGVDAAT